MERRQFLDDLKMRHDLREEFPFALSDQHGRMVKPRRGGNGRTIIGLCPFHQRSSGTPSLSASRTHYRCYGGCAGQWWERGDIFTLTMKLHDCNFSEAVERLAEGRQIEVDPGTIAVFSDKALETIPELEPLADSTMRDYFQQLTPENAKPLLDMGFEYTTLEWAQICHLWSGVFAFPIYEDGKLMNVKLYDPYSPRWKWMPFFTNRRKQLYLMDDAVSMGMGYVTLYESEKDALLSRQWGVPSAATGGATSWNNRFVERLLPFDWIFGMKDLDEAGENWAVTIKRSLPRFMPIDWRLLNPELPEKFDLGKYILQGGTPDKYVELIRAAHEGRYLYDGF